MNTPNNRLQLVDMMIGFVMILVVLGHMSFNFAPQWYNEIFHTWIYSFHMELFIFLSALLIRYSYKGVHNFRQYIHYEWRKFRKFFFPFILVGVVVGLSSAYLNDTIKAQGGWFGTLWNELALLLTWPMQSHASFLWYIYILMGFYLISPLYFKLSRWQKMILCLFSIVPTLPEITYHFGAALFCKYLFFYALGVLCAEGIEDLRKLQWWHWMLSSLPFVGWTVYFSVTQDHSLLPIFTGMLSLPAVAFIGICFRNINWIRWCMTKISSGCYWIYLLQMFIAWGCAIVFRNSSLLIQHVPFWCFMIITAVLCLCIPLLFQALSNKLLSSPSVSQTRITSKNKAAILHNRKRK